nr:MAG TPA: hypothetical protein [Caudoviricetes sp.]DAW37111.1 MAG TPA: hypothetical protein [Caudoviricetes sp.]
MPFNDCGYAQRKDVYPQLRFQGGDSKVSPPFLCPGGIQIRTFKCIVL